jgi:hypothetical protein
MSLLEDPRLIDSLEPDAWTRMGLPREADYPPPPHSEPCYVRFGHRPPGDRSYNHIDGWYEPGVAVFKAFKTPLDEYVIYLEEKACLAVNYLRIRPRPAYRVTGTECGKGRAG